MDSSEHFHSCDDFDDLHCAGVSLSRAGEARKEEMLCLLERELLRRRRRRRAVRWIGMAVVPLALVAGSVLVLSSHLPWSRPRSGDIADMHRKGSTTNVERAYEAPELRHVRLEVVHDDPGILERYSVGGGPLDRDVWIADDDELLALLETAQRPAGLIRTGGRVILTANVTSPRN